MYKIAYLDIYLGWENKSQQIIDDWRVRILSSVFLGNLLELLTQKCFDGNLALCSLLDPPAAPNNTQHSQRPLKRGSPKLELC